MTGIMAGAVLGFILLFFIAAFVLGAIFVTGPFLVALILIIQTVLKIRDRSS